MSRIVVTGASGFLGSHIADELSRRGHQVVVFDRRPSPYLREDQEIYLGDLLDTQDLEKALHGADYVYHLAGLADLNDAQTMPRETVELNVLGTVGLLETACRAEVKRVLFASTVYVYSRSGGFYRCSKQACEAYIEEYQRQRGLEFTVLRYGSLYGPRATEKNGVYSLLLQALQSEPIRKLGTPEDTREYIHVEDAARLSVDVLDPSFANERVILTGHHPMRFRDLFTMFSEILGRPLDVEYLEGEEDDGHYRMTPYAFSPKPGRKLTSSFYVDMGQGILQILEEIRETSLQSTHGGGP